LPLRQRRGRQEQSGEGCNESFYNQRSEQTISFSSISSEFLLGWLLDVVEVRSGIQVAGRMPLKSSQSCRTAQSFCRSANLLQGTSLTSLLPIPRGPLFRQSWRSSARSPSSNRDASTTGCTSGPGGCRGQQPRQNVRRLSTHRAINTISTISAIRILWPGAHTDAHTQGRRTFTRARSLISEV
jgi:hypothetical protein